MNQTNNSIPQRNSTPQRVTILRTDRNWFNVIAEECGELSHAELTYDEMLGALARMFCPTMSDGKPNRFVGRPLFLAPPEPPAPEPPKHPDAGGDFSPAGLKEFKLAEEQLAEARRNNASLQDHLVAARQRIAESEEKTPSVFDNDNFDAKTFTDFHWQVRKLSGPGKIRFIWNIYPTTRKVCGDPKHSGPRLEITDWEDLDLEKCVNAAISACLKKGV